MAGSAPWQENEAARNRLETAAASGLAVMAIAGYSLRAMNHDDLLKQATFARLPAAAAGQVFPRTPNNLAGHLAGSHSCPATQATVKQVV